MKTGKKTAQSFQESIMEEYARRIKKNRKYSLRAFAKYLGLNHSSLSRIIRGKQKPTLRLVEQVSKKLTADPKTLSKWKKDISKELTSKGLTQDLEWLCMVITHLLKQSDFSPNTFWIAGKLGIPFNEVNIALSWMCSQGELQMDGKHWRWLPQDTKGHPQNTISTCNEGQSGYPVVHWQILSKDIQKTVQFCNKAFFWKTDSNNSLGYHEVRNATQKSIAGGIWPIPPDKNSSVQLFVLVPDIKKAFSDAIKLGGIGIITPQNLPDGDKIAVIQDPAGVTFGLQEKK